MWESVCLKVCSVFTSVKSVFTSGFQRRLQCNADLSSAQARNVNIAISSFFKWISLRCHWFSYIYVGILSILSHHWFLKACEHMFQMREGRKKNWQMWFLRVEKRCHFFIFLRPFQNTKYEQRQKYCIYYALYHNQNLSTSRALQGLRPLHRLLNFPSDVRFPWKRIMKFKTCFFNLAELSASRSSPLIVTSTKIQQWKNPNTKMPSTPTSPA